MANGQVQQKKGGCGAAILIGCLSLVVLVPIGGYVGYRVLKSVLTSQAMRYTDEQPMEMPEVVVAAADAQAVVDRVKAFGEAVRANQPCDPLQLTSDDINILIQKAAGEAAGMPAKFHVVIEGNQMKGDMSLPMDVLATAAKGVPMIGDILAAVRSRHLNVSGVFKINLSGGLMVIVMDDMTVRGEPLPESFMKEMRKKNLADNINADPKAAQAFEKFESISVRDGILEIVPKQSQ